MFQELATRQPRPDAVCLGMEAVDLEEDPGGMKHAGFHLPCWVRIASRVEIFAALRNNGDAGVQAAPGDSSRKKGDVRAARDCHRSPFPTIRMPQFQEKNKMVHFRSLPFIAACLVAGLTVPQSGEAQVQKNGTFKELRQQGRLTQIVVLDDAGSELEINLTPKVDFQIRAAGDKGFVAPGQILEGEGVLTNERIYISNVTIRYVPPKQRVSARGQIAKAPPRPGRSTNAYLVSGMIEAAQPDTDYPDFTLVGLKATRGPLIMLEKDFKVTVVANDPKLIPEGSIVSMEGMELRGGKFNASKLVVNLKTPLKSEDLLTE